MGFDQDCDASQVERSDLGETDALTSWQSSLSRRDCFCYDVRFFSTFLGSSSYKKRERMWVGGWPRCGQNSNLLSLSFPFLIVWLPSNLFYASSIEPKRGHSARLNILTTFSILKTINIFRHAHVRMDGGINSLKNRVHCIHSLDLKVIGSHFLLAHSPPFSSPGPKTDSDHRNLILSRISGSL